MSGGRSVTACLRLTFEFLAILERYEYENFINQFASHPVSLCDGSLALGSPRRNARKRTE